MSFDPNILRTVSYPNSYTQNLTPAAEEPAAQPENKGAAPTAPQSPEQKTAHLFERSRNGIATYAGIRPPVYTTGVLFGMLVPKKT